MGDVYAGALLCEQAEWELRELGDDRKGTVADLFARRYLHDGDRLRGIDAAESPALERFDALLAGTLADERAR